MAYPAYIREKARQMRRERRMTLDEIAERLAISKTTVWYWIQDIALVPPGRALDTPARRHVRDRAARIHSAKAADRRRGWYAEGAAMYPGLALEPRFRDFVCMYIGEGYRRNRNRVAIGNSNPKVVVLADAWIRRFTVNKVDYAIQHHADQDVRELRRFWSKILKVSEDAFRIQRKSNSSQLAKRTWRSEHAVLTVGTNDTAFRARLQAWMDCVQSEWDLDWKLIGV